MDKEHMVFIHNGILFRHKKKEILPYVNMGKLEDIMLSQTEKDKYGMTSLFCGI